MATPTKQPDTLEKQWDAEIAQWPAAKLAVARAMQRRILAGEFSVAAKPSLWPLGKKSAVATPAQPGKRTTSLLSDLLHLNFWPFKKGAATTTTPQGQTPAQNAQSNIAATPANDQGATGQATGQAVGQGNSQLAEGQAGPSPANAAADQSGGVQPATQPVAARRPALNEAMPLSEARAERLFSEVSANPLLTKQGNVNLDSFRALSQPVQLSLASGCAHYGDQSFLGLVQGAVEDAKGNAKAFAKAVGVEAPVTAGNRLPEDTKFHIREEHGIRHMEIQVDRAGPGLDAGSYSPQEVFAKGFKLPAFDFGKASPGTYEYAGGRVCLALPPVAQNQSVTAPSIPIKQALALSERRALQLYGVLTAASLPLVTAAGQVDPQAYAALPDRAQVQLTAAMAASGNPKAFLGELQGVLTAAQGNPQKFANALKVEAAPNAKALPEGTRFAVMVLGDSPDMRAVQVQIDHPGYGLGVGSYSPEDLMVRGYKMPANFDKAPAGSYMLSQGAVMSMTSFTEGEAEAQPVAQSAKVAPRRTRKQTVAKSDPQAVAGPVQAVGSVTSLEQDARTKLHGVNWAYFLVKNPDTRAKMSADVGHAHKAFDALAAQDPAAAKRLWAETSADRPSWVSADWVKTMPAAAVGQAEAVGVAAAVAVAEPVAPEQAVDAAEVAAPRKKGGMGV